ncbi:hypothetical protein LXL04_024263 [Taraxacum kok-saghyz]
MARSDRPRWGNQHFSFVITSTRGRSSGILSLWDLHFFHLYREPCDCAWEMGFLAQFTDSATSQHHSNFTSLVGRRKASSTQPKAERSAALSVIQQDSD